MSFNRARYKAAKLEANKAVSKEFDIFKMNKLERGDYHTIEMGANVFRILPPHNENEPSFQPKAIYWLWALVDEKDKDGKPTGKKIRPKKADGTDARSPIFDSRIHGGTEKDIVDEFIKFARKLAWENYQDKEQRTKVLYPIIGYRSKDQKWHPGILISQSYVCYATKDEIVPKNIGRLELFKADKEKLEELNIAEDSDEPITTDIFSDPDDGRQFVITLKTGDDGKTVRVVSVVKEPSTKGLKGKERDAVLDEFYEGQIVSDEVLEQLDKMQPLSEMFKGAYKRSDFEKALEALEYLDNTKLKFDIFSNDEWLDIVEEIDSYYPEEDKKGNDDEDDEGVDIDDMTRSELKEYIIENKLDIRVKQSWSEDQIRSAIRDKMGEIVEEEDYDDEEEEDNTPIPTKKTTRQTAQELVRKKKVVEEASAVPETPAKRRKRLNNEDLPF